ncbi:MAG: HvfC family RiPP maturation protein [Gammaproteobacteria bacterium]
MKAFQKVQYDFAAHLRDPKRNKAPRGIEARRMKIYRELFYNNVQGFLENAFPVLRRITPDARWHAMARDFFARHESRQPLFYRIAEEFLKYLERERGRVKGDPPFLRELAHYEWVELALSVSPAAPGPADAEGDLLEGVPLLSPLAWPLSYEFPVHRIGPEFQPKEAGPDATHLVVWRNARDEVKFMEVNAVAARLLQLMAPGRATGRRMLERIARELRHPLPDVVVAQGRLTLNDFRERGIITGTKTVSSRA